MTRICRVAVITSMAVAGLALSSPSSARDAETAFIPAGDVADAPSGFVELCARNAVLCKAGIEAAPIRQQPAGIALAKTVSFSDAGLREAPYLPIRSAAPQKAVAIASLVSPTVAVSTAPAMDPAQEFAFVKAINSEVNRAIRPMADYQTTGTDERWDRPGRGKYLVGDCEDFAIEKRMRLIEGGFSPNKLFYAVAYVKGYGMHILLIARLQSGDMVLDSISPHVLSWTKVKYSWLRVQSTQDPMTWRRVGAPSTTNQMAASGQSATAG